jgi:hypothetical protein
MRLFSRKIKALLCFALFFGGLWNCSGVNEVTFNVPVIATAEIEKGNLLEDLINQFGFGSFLNVDIASTQEFKNQNVERARITKAMLTKLTLTIEAPTDQNFDFLERLTFFVESDGLPKVEVASITFPKGARTVEMTVTNADIAAHLRAERISLTTEVKGRKPTQKTTVKAVANFQISARLL